MTEEKKKRIGKFISLVLRHSPETIGLNLDDNGWAEVSELIEKSKTRKMFFTKDELQEIVKTNDKQRYSYNENKTKIRANQGHSINIDLELKPLSPPDVLYHGTATRFVESILEKGIVKGSRQHVHLSKEIDTATKVGSRHGKPAIFLVDAVAMAKDGYQFFQSDNGVWLTDFVPQDYITLAEE